jgi:hypothetical protein
MHAAPPHARKIHESVDPKRVNTRDEHIRECLDSDEHPLTVPVFVGFDETGSMGNGPRIIVDKLAALKGLTLRAGMPDVQLCFGAYGDTNYDEVAPCQVGQFESGLEMEEWLNNLFLEGQGGGNGGESASLLLWWLGTHSRLDSLDKRGKKGYLFLTGDEIALPVSAAQVERYTGEKVQSALSVADCVAAAQTHYNVIFFLVNNHTAKAQRSQEFWTEHLGADNVIIVQDLENIAELISGVIAFEEGVVSTVDDVTSMLSAEGVTSTALEVVSSTLAARTSSGSVSAVSTDTGSLDASAASSAEFL